MLTRAGFKGLLLKSAVARKYTNGTSVSQPFVLALMTTKVRCDRSQEMIWIPIMVDTLLVVVRCKPMEAASLIQWVRY